MFKALNKTKIIATVGPATDSFEKLEELVAAGVDVFRLNFSHGTHAQHAAVIEHILAINRKHDTHVSILADLQGPKLRIGTMKDDQVMLAEDSVVTFTTEDCVGTAERVPITYEDFPKDVKKGELVLVDDGKLELKVLETNQKDEVKLRVIYGGPLLSKKGVNLPDTKLSTPSLTEKDKIDLEFAVAHNANWIALSFVRQPQDVINLKRILNKRNRSIKLIAKIEKPEAIQNIDAIIKASDGIMVARGDLGVEVPMDKISIIQKDIVNRCILAAKPVIIATQIMESMIRNPKPTRAEINDVANAVFDGADALMVSGETATGKYPVKVIETIGKILQTVEQEDTIYNKNLKPRPSSKTFLSDAICYNACKIANDVDARAIVGMTKSGYTAFTISSYRPKSKIFIFTNNKKIIYALSMIWGVSAFYYDQFESTDSTIQDVNRFLKEKGFIRSGDIVINTNNMPIDQKGKTNMLKINKIE